MEFWKAGEATEEETRAAYEKSLELIEEAEFKSTLNPKTNCLLFCKSILAPVALKVRIGQKC